MTYIELIEKNTNELIEVIKNKKRLPDRKESYSTTGADMYYFYTSLIDMNKNKKFTGKKFNNDEIIRLNKCLNSINFALNGKKNDDNTEIENDDKKDMTIITIKNIVSINNKNFLITAEICTKEIIDFIENKKRLPKYGEKKLSIGIDARRFITELPKAYDKEKDINIKRKTIALYKVKECLTRIDEVLKKYNITYIGEITPTEKTEQIINTIVRKGKLPDVECFEDGMTQIAYYKSLRYLYSKSSMKKEKTVRDEEIIKCWLYLEWIMNYIKYRAYRQKYSRNYIINNGNRRIQKWYLEQIRNYYNTNDKTMEQLEKEEYLNEVDPKWMGNSYSILEEPKILKI